MKETLEANEMPSSFYRLKMDAKREGDLGNVSWTVRARSSAGEIGLLPFWALLGATPKRQCLCMS